MTRFKHVLLGKRPRRTLIRAVFLAIISFIFFSYVIRPARIQGISMAPTLENGEFRMINLVHYVWSVPIRGDIVAINMPGGRSYYLKRILGLPGETIAFEDGRLFINHMYEEEPYVTERGNWNLAPTLIPDGHFFVAGDNRTTQFDLHTLGVVDESQLAGVLLK